MSHKNVLERRNIMYVVAVFINRTQALQFAEVLRRMGVQCNIINTPREISNSCGLAVMFQSVKIGRARVVLNSGNFTGFKGFYNKKNTLNGAVYERVN